LISAKMVRALITQVSPPPCLLFLLSTKCISQHQFTHSLNPSEVIGSRGDDQSITIFR
jgi:hypothetical protein